MSKANAGREEAHGLYETLITEVLDERLRQLDARAHASREVLLPAEAADRIALHLGRLIASALADGMAKDP